MKKLIYFIIGANIILLLYLATVIFNREEGDNHMIMENYHIHADFILYLDGEVFDFSDEIYQSSNEELRHNTLHLHDGDGKVIHIHQKERTLYEFLSSIGVDIANSCITVVGGGVSYCESEDKGIKVFVNEEEMKGDEYIFNDLDRILVYYGVDDENIIDDIFMRVSDTACIFSEKCPERGTAPEESCGSGSNCNAIQ